MTVDNATKWIVLDYEETSLYNLIADGEYRQTFAGRDAWKSLIAGSSLQPNCNKEGFGISHRNYIEIRLGYLANNQMRCSTPDSCIGFGIYYQSCYVKRITITCGNIALCSQNDNGQKILPAFGYILVQ